ncbi:glycosyltransferase family 4 protein [Candidatus Woesearchaeota archaeon]|nr:glycosyltransferase family 4 protein [Candidatus Woesearchaeota archaeon]
MKKKLLIATDNFLPRWDGISRFLLEIIPHLKDDFDITVLAPKFKGKFKKPAGIDVVRFDTFNIQLGDFYPAKPSIKKIKEYIAETDIVWTQGLGPIGALSIIYGKKLGKKVVSYVHSIEWELFSKSIRFFKSLVHYMTEIFAKMLYNKSSLILAPSLEVKEILNWIGVKTKIKVVHLGIDTSVFKPADNKKEAKKKIGVGPETKVIGFSGRIAREKDLMTLYRAFLKLERDYKDVILLIVGEGLENLKKIFDIKPNIKAVGAVDNVVPYLQAMDIFVLPSLTETSSLATMEAMACETAIVTTKVGYVKRYIKDKFNGVFFPKKNDLVLSLKLKWLFDNEYPRNMMAKNARKTIVDNYQWHKTVEKIKSILISV